MKFMNVPLHLGVCAYAGK